MSKIIASLLLVLTSALPALAQGGPGPGPAPQPWMVNGPTIYYNQGGVLVGPNTLISQGIGTINSSVGYYVNGSPIAPVVGGLTGQMTNGVTSGVPIWTYTPTLGASGILGSLTFGNATSGTVTLEPVTGALGTVTAQLPANIGVIAELNYAQTWTAIQTAAGLTTTQPGWYAQVAGDAYARVRVGLNSTDVASIAFGSGSVALDTFIERAGAASLRFGAPDAAVAIAQTLGVQNVVAGTSNIAGANTTLNGSQGTGTGAGGAWIFKIAPAGSSGTAQNAEVAALTINPTGGITIGAAPTGGDKGAGTINAAGLVYSGGNTLAVSASLPVVLNATTGNLTCPTCATSTLNAAALTEANDTNVTLTLGGSPSTALLNATSITAGWTGTLAAGRLNANVVQSFTNDTNVTATISAQVATLGWTGTLAVGRGGIGVGTLALNGILYGNGTSAVQALAVNASATVGFLSQASSGAPAWVTSTGTGSVMLAGGPTASSLTVTTAFTATGLVTLADLATQAANTVLLNGTSGVTSPTAYAMASCSGAANAVQWLTNTGFQCGTITAAASSIAYGTTTAGTSVGIPYNTTNGGTLSALTPVSGGILYGASATTPAFSAALTQYGVLFGGGAGGAPTAGTAGTAGQFLVGQTSVNAAFESAGGDVSSISSGGSFTFAASNTNLTTLANLTTVGTIGTGTWQGSTIAATYLPLATNAAKGIMEGDGVTISCTAGVCQALGASATSITASNTTGATTVSSGNPGYALTQGASSNYLANNQLFSAAGGFINKFRNGTLAVWQRGTSALTTATSGAYTADGWIVGQSGAAFTCAQDTGNGGTLYSLKCVGGTSNTDTVFQQHIESYDAAALAGQTVTVQYYFKQDTGGSITPKVYSGYASTTDNFSTITADLASTSLSACTTGTWCLESYTFTVSANAKKGYAITLDCNTALTSSQHCWVTAADVRVTPNVATGINANPPPPELRSVMAEVTQSERFFQKSYDLSVVPGTATLVGIIGYNANNSVQNFPYVVLFRTRMRADPTIAYWDGAGNSSKVSYFTNNVETDNAGSVTVQWQGNTGFGVYSTGGQGFLHYTANAEL